MKRPPEVEYQQLPFKEENWVFCIIYALIAFAVVLAMVFVK